MKETRKMFRVSVLKSRVQIMTFLSDRRPGFRAFHSKGMRIFNGCQVKKCNCILVELLKNLSLKIIFAQCA